MLFPLNKHYNLVELARKHSKPQAADTINVPNIMSWNRYQQMADPSREEEQVNLLGEEGIRAGGAGAQGQNLKLG